MSSASFRAPKHPGINLGPAHREADESAGELLFGFWVYLMSDAVIFGCLFATYVIMLPSTAGGPGPRDIFQIKSAFIETAALLFSSFTYGMASLSLKYGRSSTPIVLWIGATILLAGTFLRFEIMDFLSAIHKGAGPDRSGFASAYFALVPLHGLHVTVGTIWMAALVVQLWIYGVDKEVKLGFLRLGLFWHFLDIVWVAIFSVVYLGGLA
jgi:cytochrome o ubiquinol oxidase subunit III